ncbi:hypothetical protein, partial [Salmonella sp. s55044]
FVQVGRVVFVAVGKYTGQLCVIVNIIDQTRVLVDGPLSGVRRHAIRLKWIQLTDFMVKISPGTRAKTLKAAWTAADIDEKWHATRWYQALEAKKRRAAMSDFDRFKLMVVKKKRNRIVEKEIKKLRKMASAAK